MIRGTTPSIIFTIDGHDLTGAKYIVTFICGSYTLEKTQDDCELIVENGNSHIYITLTQEETFAMTKSVVRVQINWIYPDGCRKATEIEAAISTKKNLHEKVMTYDE